MLTRREYHWQCLPKKEKEKKEVAMMKKEEKRVIEECVERVFDALLPLDAEGKGPAELEAKWLIARPAFLWRERPHKWERIYLWDCREDLAVFVLMPTLGCYRELGPCTHAVLIEDGELLTFLSLLTTFHTVGEPPRGWIFFWPEHTMAPS